MGEMKCRCGKHTKVWVLVPPDLSRTGKPYTKEAVIDKCIAPIVEALQAAGIHMRGSCCGHGQYVGEIHLWDGETVILIQQAPAAGAPGEQEGD